MLVCVCLHTHHKFLTPSLYMPHTYTHTREDNSLVSRYTRAQKNDEIDAKYGFERYHASTERMGWLINMHPVSPRILFMYTVL